MLPKPRIAFVGAGKLGYPVASAIASRGFEVKCYDINKNVLNYKPRPYLETGPDGKEDFNIWFSRNSISKNLTFANNLFDLAKWADIIFVAVQTPHDPKYEGITELPNERKDFDYTYLKQAMSDLVLAIDYSSHIIPKGKKILISVISTVLPGTMRREIFPIIAQNPRIEFAYNPSFIAMGTTARDFLEPEFVLVGCDNRSAGNRL